MIYWAVLVFHPVLRALSRARRNGMISGGGAGFGWVSAEEQAPFMNWKARKEKLRAETNDAPQTSADPAPASELTAPAPSSELTAPAEAMPLDAVSLDPLPHEAEEALTIDAPFDLADTQPAFPDTVLHLDKPETPVFVLGTDSSATDSPAFDPLSFAPSSDLDSGAAFALGDLDTLTDSLDSGEEDAPVFGLDSVFVPDEGDDAPEFAPLLSAFDPLPDEAADALAMPMPGPEPIVLGEESPSTPGAFVSYQPENSAPQGEALAMGLADEDAYADPDLEVGAMAFAPQSPSFGTFNPEAPTAGEEIAQEPLLPAFADPQDTSPLAFEPSFEAPEALAGEALPDEADDPNAPFMDREALAAGLVTMEAGTGLPRVAPFVLPGIDTPLPGEEENKPHSLVLRLSGLSATYPLVKPVTTIGRPDGPTGTYPDIEVDLDDGVSRRHAEVRQEGSSVYVVDVGSTNGTILNGELLTPHQPAPLLRGDRIRIGERVEIVFE